jgi:endonuclease YncB( thermonuclease family)
VVGVVASNIIDVLIDGVEYRVRYLLIDTPAFEDPVRGTEPFGLEALEINRQLVTGQTVALEKDVSDVDEVGLLWRYVYVGDMMVNEELVRQGVAWVDPVPPDTRHQSRLENVQRDTQAAGIGIWSLDSSAGPTPPAPAQIVIIAVNDVEEYVDLQNVGNSPQDLTGWRLLSERDGQSCTFAGVTMQPGESLRVWALLADSVRGGYNCGFAQNIWSNTEPDPAVLFNPEGIEVSRLD